MLPLEAHIMSQKRLSICDLDKQLQDSVLDSSALIDT